MMKNREAERFFGGRGGIGENVISTERMIRTFADASGHVNGQKLPTSKGTEVGHMQRTQGVGELSAVSTA